MPPENTGLELMGAGTGYGMALLGIRSCSKKESGSLCLRGGCRDAPGRAAGQEKHSVNAGRGNCRWTSPWCAGILQQSQRSSNEGS